MNEKKLDIPELLARVEQFNALELPGQPMGMHMGTMYLVGDLKRAVLVLQARLKLAQKEFWAIYSSAEEDQMRAIALAAVEDMEKTPFCGEKYPARRTIYDKSGEGSLKLEGVSLIKEIRRRCPTDTDVED